MGGARSTSRTCRSTSTRSRLKMTSDALLVSGSKSSSVKAMEHMFANCDKTRTSMIKIDDVADVLNEAQVKLANSVLLFVKGLGWLTSVSLPNVERKSSKDMSGRRMSMEDYDEPNIRRLSLTNPEAGALKSSCGTSGGTFDGW